MASLNQLEPGQKLARYPLRDYQEDWIEKIYGAWKSGNRRVLAQLPTGGGKTVALAHISRDFLRSGKKVLVIAHRLELVEQAAEKLFEVVGEPAGIIKHGIEPHLDRKIQVASIQTLFRRDLSEIAPDVGLLICDEAHHASASSYRQVFEFYKGAVILGVTATPLRMDGQGFQDLFDSLVIGETTSVLIRRGYLAPYRLFVSDSTISTVGVKQSKKDFVYSDLALAVTTQISLEDIFNNWKEYAPFKRTVIFASSLEHSKALASRFRANGIGAEHLDGDTPEKERRGILQRFSSGETLVITNYQILTEGYDCAEIECVYCVRPTLSPTLWLQMVGRSLRSSPQKKSATIIDLTENWKKHGLPDDERTWSLEPNSLLDGRYVPGLARCSACTHVFRPLTKELEPISWSMGEDGRLIEHYQAICPSCGASVDFSRSESKRYRRLLRLKSSLHPEIKEVDLSVSPIRLRTVYDLIVAKRLRQLPTPEAYKAIFMGLITTIIEYSLGDWREIVKMVEPKEALHSQKAWQLYQEAKVRHKNRMAALAHLKKRQQKQLPVTNNQLPNKQLPVASEQLPNDSQTLVTGHCSLVTEIKSVGNDYFRQRYEQEWCESLSELNSEYAEFFQKNAGLFFVEQAKGQLNISIEVINSDLVRKLRQTEVETAFSKGFNSQVNVMFRMALAHK